MIKVKENPEQNTVIHKIPAGAIPSDDRYELFGDRKTKKVFYMHNGKTLPMRFLPRHIIRKLYDQLKSDPIAWEDLKHLPFKEGLERYAYCIYGTLDHQADIGLDGELGESDNFLCGDRKCNCINWKSKIISFKGQVIEGRLLDVLLAYKEGLDDRNVAARLNLALSTLYGHKKRLFDIFGVFSKSEMIIKAIDSKIIQ